MGVEMSTVAVYADKGIPSGPGAKGWVEKLMIVSTASSLLPSLTNEVRRQNVRLGHGTLTLPDLLEDAEQVLPMTTVAERRYAIGQVIKVMQRVRKAVVGENPIFRCNEATIALHEAIISDGLEAALGSGAGPMGDRGARR